MSGADTQDTSGRSRRDKQADGPRVRFSSNRAPVEKTVGRLADAAIMIADHLARTGDHISLRALGHRFGAHRAAIHVVAALIGIGPAAGCIMSCGAKLRCGEQQQSGQCRNGDECARDGRTIQISVISPVGGVSCPR